MMIQQVFEAVCPDRSAQTALDHYIKALGHIVAYREEEANGALKSCINALVGSRHWTRFSDADLQRLVEDPALTVSRFYSMFGDYGCKGTSAWIKDADTLRMIHRHRDMLAAPQAQQQIVVVPVPEERVLRVA